MDYEMLLPEIQKIAWNAGSVIMNIYRRFDDFGVEEKEDHSPLTLADRAANDIICRNLAALPFAFPIISEENKLLPYEERRHWSRCWMVDPLDGTKEFIRRNDEFTVNIALIEEGKPVLGVVYAPALDIMAWAVAGGGAFLKKNRHATPIEAATFSYSDSFLNVVCSRSHLTGETQAFISQFDQPNIVSRGSSLKFLTLASGEAHVYPRIAPTMEWDTAAAQIILEEAGGQVLEFDSRKPMRYNKENLRNPSFLALGKLKNNTSLHP